MKFVSMSCVALTVFCTGAVAAEARRADPMDPAAKAPPVQYRSALENYQPFKEQEVGNWRGANDEVREAGGHKSHAAGQGSGGNAPPKPPAGQPQQSPAAKGHEGHK